jgi:hypothetical protein
MSKRFDEIARRKEVLIERCAQEREELAAAFEQIRLPLNLGALLMAVGKVLRAYPMAVTGLSGLFVAGYGAKLTRFVGKWVRFVRITWPFWSWWSKRRRAA